MEKPKPSSDIDLITIKTNLGLSVKEIEKISHKHSSLDGHLGTDDWDFILFEQYKTHTQLKETENFWQLNLNPLGLNEKEGCLH